MSGQVGARAAVARVLVMGAGAFVLYGGWAFHANYDYGVDVRLRAGFVQGSATFVSTLVLTTAMEVVFRRCEPGRARFWITALGPQLAMTLVTIGVHTLAGTPEILATIAPPFVIGGIYAAVYTYKLEGWSA